MLGNRDRVKTKTKELGENLIRLEKLNKELNLQIDGLNKLIAILRNYKNKLIKHNKKLLE